MDTLGDYHAPLRARLNKTKTQLRNLQAKADLAQAETRLQYQRDLTELHTRQLRLEEQLGLRSR